MVANADGAADFRSREQGGRLIEFTPSAQKICDANASESTQNFVRRLLGVSDMPSLAAIAIDEARARFGVEESVVSWSTERVHADGTSGSFGCHPPEGIDGADVRRISLLSAPNGTRADWAWRAKSASDFRPGSGWDEFLADLTLVAKRILQRESLTQSVSRLERAEHVQRALFAIANMVSSDLDMPDMLDGIHEIVGWLMYAENFFIAQYEPERDTLRFLYFVDTLDQTIISPSREIAASDAPNSLTLAMIRSGESQMGPSDQVRDSLGVPRDESFGPASEDWLGVPMIGASAAIRGAIVVQSYLPDTRYSEEDRTILNYVAQHILTALERKQARNDLEGRVVDRTRELASAIDELKQEVSERMRGERSQRALFDIAECAAAADSMADFYASIHRIVGGLLNARNFYIALVTGDAGELEFPYSVDEINSVRPRRPISKGMTEYVLRTGRALLADRAMLDELVELDEVQRFGTRASFWLGVPLICNDVAVGVLAVQSYSPDSPFTQRDQELLTFVAYHIANGLERKRAQESLLHDNVKLEARVVERTRELAFANRDLTRQIGERQRIEARLTHEAFHDSLTGLPNRSLLLQHLESAMGHFQGDGDRRYAVLFLDLDRFKVINDSVGHLVGDEMLKQVATRLAATCKPFEVARLGGDEFAVLVDELPDAEIAVTLANRILEALNDPIRVSGKEMFTSASIGIAYADNHYRRAEELLRDADTAMYRAKAQGRKRHEIFDEHLRAQAMRALDLEGDLRRALVRREFEPHFQPIVDLSDGSVVGYEALLRWNHPTRGLLLPGDFLAAAEDNGCVEQIDWQMFTMACEQARRLPDSSYVSINVSARRLRVPEFDDVALRTILDNGLHPYRIRLEVTEGALLDQPEQMRSILLRLRNAGVLVQLDDFGTGYSSLSYLHRFPIHSLKIDRSFVSDLALRESNPVVIKAIIALAKSLDVQVIAEGVETHAQRDALLEMGCQVGQGFLYSIPLPIEQLLQLT